MAIHLNRYGSIHLHSYMFLIVENTITISTDGLIVNKVPASLPTSGHSMLLILSMLISMIGLPIPGFD